MTKAETETYKIHQIYFKANQLSELDPAFIPFDNSACAYPDEREYYVFRTEFEAGRIAPDGYTGYVSWKFGEKTGLTGQAFIDFMRANPGHDVYFVNPYPMEIFLGNVWQQGDHRHPGLMGVAQAIFAEASPGFDLAQVPRSLRATAFCNFWVGNKRFWAEFMAFCRPIYDHIQSGLTPEFKMAFESQADPFRSASYFSFLFERLFTTFIGLHRSSGPALSAKGYAYSDAQLAQKYSQDGVVILRSLMELEAAHPGEAQPIDRSPLIRSALNLYLAASEQSFTPLGFWLYNSLRRLAVKLPNKDRLSRTKLYRRLTRVYARALLPKSAQTTLPPAPPL